MNTENQSFIKNNIKFMIHQTHNEMIDSYSNQIESFRIVFGDDNFNKLIDEFFKSHNYMLHNYLKKLAKMKLEFKLINIKSQLSKHVSKHKFDDDKNNIDDDENNKTIDFNNIIINI